MLKLRLLFFATLKDRAGQNQLELELLVLLILAELGDEAAELAALAAMARATHGAS